MIGNKDNIVEAYIGEYASGKSEVAINRALQLLRQGRKVTLADLDTVEPFYTLRPLKKKLEQTGLHVIAWDNSEVMGFGETGVLLKPGMRWALNNSGDVILDIGYGVQGAKVLDILEGANTHAELKLLCVINIGRPMTANVSDIVEYVRSVTRVDGLINNSHLGEYTDIDFINEGSGVCRSAADILGIPVVATTAEQIYQTDLGTHDANGIEVRYLTRWMPSAIW